VHCASAGIAANQANECPSEAREAAEAFGVSLDVHTPTLLTPAMMDEFDLIVVMEAGQLRLLRERFGHAGSRLVLLSLLDGDDRRGYARYNIADPFGQPRTAFDACYRRIDGALQSFIHLLSTSRLPPAADRLASTR
jgi:protein-tyrosine-phosphatase